MTKSLITNQTLPSLKQNKSIVAASALFSEGHLIDEGCFADRVVASANLESSAVRGLSKQHHGGGCAGHKQAILAASPHAQRIIYPTPMFGNSKPTGIFIQTDHQEDVINHFQAMHESGRYATNGAAVLKVIQRNAFLAWNEFLSPSLMLNLMFKGSRFCRELLGAFEGNNETKFMLWFEDQINQARIIL